jgi:hypothetical protein
MQKLWHMNLLPLVVLGLASEARASVTVRK